MTEFVNFNQYQGSDKVVLVSKEGDKFNVKKELALMSVLVKTMIDDDDNMDVDDDEVQEVPLINVSSSDLMTVLEFCKYHSENGPMPEIEKPLTDTDLKKVVSEWDGTFIQALDQEKLFAIILAANYMDIKSLLDLACAQVATQIKGKTPEEIRQTFNIQNDFTPEEEETIREENRWCSD